MDKVQEEENSTNPEVLFSTIENRITTLKSKLKSIDDSQKFELVDRNDLKTKLTEQFNSLLNKNFSLLKNSLQTKPSPSNNNSVLIQETCVRLLTLCVQQSFEYAKQVAVEFNYFNEKKNWLEKFLLMKQTDLREMSIEFLLSYLKYTKTGSSLPGGENSSGGDVEDRGMKNEYSALIKRILFKIETKTDTKSQQNNQLSVIYCLFLHIGTDSKQSIEFLMQELLFKFVQNDSFNKSERIRLFSEKTLANIAKLYEWKDQNDSETEENGFDNIF
jgi:hypothetical protein